MDVFFKKYFWTVNLAALGVVAFQVASIANTFVAGALVELPDIHAQAASHVAVQRHKKTPVRTLASITDRNIFGAKREDLKAPKIEKEPEPEPVEPGEEPITSLRAGLIATIVAEQQAWSLAVIEDQNARETGVYGVGDTLMGTAKVLEVYRDRVIVDNGGRREVLELEPKEGAPPRRRRTHVARRTTRRADSSLGKGIKKVGDSEFEIPQEEIDGALTNLNQIATQARIVPSFKNGKANGFKLFSIRPGSLYSKIGIQNGDVIQRINGYELNSPDKALEVYQKLKDARQITVDLLRRGKRQTMTYNVSP